MPNQEIILYWRILTTALHSILLMDNEASFPDGSLLAFRGSDRWDSDSELIVIEDQHVVRSPVIARRE